MIINCLKNRYNFFFAALVIIFTILIFLNYSMIRANSPVTFEKKIIGTIYKKDSIKPNLQIELINNWIVVTSINEPTEQIKKLSKIKDFQLLVVADKKTPLKWTLNSTYLLSLEQQQELDLKSAKRTPLNSYTRKNLGYLFAIAHGAFNIYDTDDDNVPLLDLNSYFNFEKSEYGLVFDCECPRVLNPYAHFGQPLIWPRGYPLNQIQNNHYNGYISGIRKTSVVQQGVVNGDPDVDAIFRLTKKMAYNKIDIQFDETAPSIQYPVGTMAPYNSQNTLFHYEAFWSLYLPHTVPFRLTDIWRGYWAQRLMWLLNETISFHGPNAYQLRNAHSYMKDFEEEQAMYVKTERLVEFLFAWRCSKTRFYDCVIDLSVEMAVNKFWEDSEVDSIRDWLDDLDKIGYEEPKIVTFETQNNTRKTADYKCRLPASNLEYTRVRYTPKFQKSIDSENFCCGGRAQEVYDNFMTIDYLVKFCQLSNAKLDISHELIGKKEKYSNITLLISFNHEPRVQNIEVIKFVYGSYFKNIIFCGSNILDLLNNTRGRSKRFDSYTFIEVNTKQGFFLYFCMTKAIELNLMTEGILHMSDDVLLKYWLLDKFDTKKIWFPFKLDCSSSYELNIKYVHPIDWGHWREGHGLAALLKVWSEFDYIKTNQDIEKNTIVENFLNYTDLNGSRNRSKITKVCAAFVSDIFYVPKSKLKSFHTLSSIFRKYEVYVEIAVSVLLAGLENYENIELIEGTYKCCGQFGLHLYQQMGYFGHASKISQYVGSKEGKQFCELFIQEKLNYMINK